MTFETSTHAVTLVF